MKRKGNPKLAPYSQTKSGGAMGDTSMRDADDWVQAGSGVDETVKSVDSMPNESVMKAEDNDHLR